MRFASLAALRFSAGLGALIAASTPVYAQTPTPAEPAATAQGEPVAADETVVADGADNASGEVVVTGSRIRRDGYDQPTPVTVATTETLLKGAPTDLATGLNQLPQFASSRSRTSCCGAGTNGNFLNLRGLGASRTLVLLDGDRVSPTTETGLVDVNLFPEMLVQRVDVVTGGASAAYGSDAVSGVINYVINRRYTGLGVQAQFGINTHGDDKSYKVGIAGGTSFADGRGRIIFSAQRFKQDGILSLYKIPGATNGHYFSGNGSATGPYRAVYGAVNASMTNGGIITNAAGVPIADAANPLAGLLFLPGGTTRAAVVGAAFPGSNAIFRNGGDGTTIDVAGPFARVSTNKLYGRAEYDITDTVTASVRINAAESKTFQPFGVEREAAPSSFIIFRDNAYLPGSVATAMDAASVTSFRLGRITREFGRQTSDFYNNTFDVAFGLDGKLGGNWTWQASYSHGESKLHGIIRNNANVANLFAAADAVRDGSNNIVCRVTLTNPGVFPGCVPINLFGEGAPSQAAIDYIVGTSEQRIKNKQDLVQVNAQGTVLTLPAGDLAVAFGAEYRRRSLVQTADALSLAQINPTGIRGFPTAYCPTANRCRFGAHTVGNFGVADAKDDVKEAFLEVSVPILKDSAIGSLDYNGAVRRTDYKNSGVVHTWKTGANYEPIDGLRFRGTFSRDIRAPNLYELFQGAVTSFQPGVIDRVTGTVNVIATVRTVGNPDLRPEKADTFTAGVVYSPKFLSGFTGSVDYYKIDIAGAIAPISAQQTIDACALGDAEACARISRDSANNISQIVSQNINVASRKTSGIDIDLTYTRPAFGGQLTLRALGNRLLNFKDSNNGVVIDYTGNIGVAGQENAGPKWRGTFSLNYQLGNFSLFAQERIQGSAKIRAASPASSNYVDPNVRGVYYTDVTLTYKLPKQGIELFGTVNNLFNETPPFIPSQLQPGVALPTAFPYYGWEIRAFTFGIRGKF